MFGTEIIEVGIGLAFAYFAISIICSGIVEAGVKITNLRARHLKSALGELLDDKHFNGFVKELYEHHLITSPLQNRIGDPTYIGSRNFALAVLDILGKNESLSDAEQMRLIEERINTIKNPQIRSRMLAMLKSSAYQVDTMRAKIEAWFNESMDAVTEWYRARMRNWVALVSVAVVVAMNADTIKMTTMFWNDDELRSATVTAADSYVKRYNDRVDAGTAPDLNRPTMIITHDSTGSDTQYVQATLPPVPDSLLAHSIRKQLDTLYEDINATKVLPIGWDTEILPGQPGFSSVKTPFNWWLIKIIGLLLTVGAVSLGSTYWYKQLKALLSLRLGKGDAPIATPAPEPPTTQSPAPQTPNLNNNGGGDTPPASQPTADSPVVTDPQDLGPDGGNGPQ